MKSWTEKDFDQLSWHDNHIHGFAIRAGEYGTGELVLDIDYILEWKCANPKAYEFLIAPATLTFISVSDLKIHFDYASSSAGISPISMDGIYRKLKKYPNGYTAYDYSIPVNWPSGEITFIAAGFVQVLRCEPKWVTQQYLENSQRIPM